MLILIPQVTIFAVFTLKPDATSNNLDPTKYPSSVKMKFPQEQTMSTLISSYDTGSYAQDFHEIKGLSWTKIIQNQEQVGNQPGTPKP